MSSIVSDRIQFARTSNREGPTGANRARATCLAPILQIRTIRGMVVPPSTPTPQPSPPTEILPAWISSDPAPTEFQSAGAFGYSRWMSGYPGGDIRHSVPTEMPSTGISRYPASTESGRRGHSDTWRGCAVTRRRLEFNRRRYAARSKGSALRLAACRRGCLSPAK
jgi:hypothetical protein